MNQSSRQNGTSWLDLAEWWLTEVAEDPAYEQVVTPLLLGVLAPEPGTTYLDLGSGEGRVMRAVTEAGATAVGVELSERLARLAGPGTAVASIPHIPIRENSVDGAYCVLTLEHLPDHDAVLAELARVVRPGGVFALVMNHPVWTAPGSTPIADVDAEVLWRPGRYFSLGSESHPAGDAQVVFHHRTMSDLLTSAASHGWKLMRLEERPHHELADQIGIPRLLAARWRLD